MKTSLKLLFLSLITPLLCGVSFGFNPLSNYDNTPYNVRNSVGSLTYNIYVWKLYCVYVEDSVRQNTYSLKTRDTVSWGCNTNQFTLMWEEWFYCFVACDNQSNFSFIGEYNNSNLSYRLYEFEDPLSVWGACSVPWQSCYDDDQIGELIQQNNECWMALDSLSWDYNTCLDTLNTRNWQVASLSWSLSTCQGSLSTCQWDLSSCSNGCDVMVNQCQESLSWCNNNLSSMTNYADSLSSQLNECLANSPEPCEGTWCDEIASGINAVFSFFWERDDQMFSLPIANNVFLPRWYRAYIDSWVVAISEYEKTSYSIDDSSFNEINKSFYSLIYWLIFLSAVALFCYYLKKFISKSFIPKEKKW